MLSGTRTKPWSFLKMLPVYTGGGAGCLVSSIENPDLTFSCL